MTNSSENILLFCNGQHKEAYLYLGAHPYEGGCTFRVWAPNVLSVSVIGSFNDWNKEKNIMNKLDIKGIWELSIKGIGKGELYKFSIEDKFSEIHVKSDPYAFLSELRPNTASIVHGVPNYLWNDYQWFKQKEKIDKKDSPINIYEVHLGSWQRDENGKFLNYREIAHKLLEYIKYMNYTHVELLPICEYPLDDSWGYQITGYYSVTSRYGTPEDFMYFVNYFHENGVGVILDWVPGHFCKDSHGLYNFDGTATYQDTNTLLGENPQWGTCNFDLSRLEVLSFLNSNALFWLKEFHIDGIRIDAVANILYLNFGKDKDFNIKNKNGGDENLSGINFLSNLNSIIEKEIPGALTFAEDSTAWPLVTKSVEEGGLGFTFKWNMGWMNDTLSYMKYDPIIRNIHHNKLTFSFMYAFAENYTLAISHDEVVHGKSSLLNKMPGDFLEKISNLKLYMAYMIAHPGKKLNFMGNELAQGLEWRFKEVIEWHVLKKEFNREYHNYIRALNKFYLEQRSFWEKDTDSRGLNWISTHKDDNTLAFSRHGNKKNDFIISFFNFSNQSYQKYKLVVPRLGIYHEVFNSYSPTAVNSGDLLPIKNEDNEYYLEIKVPPLSGIFFKGNFRR